MAKIKRIPQALKAYADKCIEARKSGQFDVDGFSSFEELYDIIMQGETCKALVEQVETRYCTVTSIILSSHHFQYTSHGYRKGIYAGFKAVAELLAGKGFEMFL